MLVSRFGFASGMFVKRHPMYHLIACQYCFPVSATKRISTAVSHIFTEYRDWLVSCNMFHDRGQGLTTRAWLTGSLVVSDIITLFCLCGECDFMCVHAC